MELTMKIRLLLLALYEYRYNGKMYELREIFARNCIQINPPEIAAAVNALVDEGLLKTLSIGDVIYGQISVDGVEFLEEHEFFNGCSYKPTDKIKPLEAELLRNSLDDMQLKWQDSHLGAIVEADILALEIEELRALINILGRRNWLQLLKGKLFELSKGQLNEATITRLLDIFDAQYAAEGKPADKRPA